MANKANAVTETFPAAASSGITNRRAVVFDSSVKGNVKLPASTPELTFAGVAIEDVSYANNVAVQVAGVAIMESDGSAVMNPGDDVILAGALGRVKSKSLTAGTATLYEIIGKVDSDGQIAATAGLYVSVRLAPYKLTAT